MKKVWILERFVSREQMDESIKLINDMVEQAKAAGHDASEIEHLEAFRDDYNKVRQNNPDGRWVGHEGRIKYSEFCYIAKAAIRRKPDYKFRVVEAQIPDGAGQWIGYKMVRVNDGVLKYLMATK